MTNKISDDKKEAQKPLTNVERIEKLKIQQEQLREEEYITFFLYFCAKLNSSLLNK